jgi:hypothetical protein
VYIPRLFLDYFNAGIPKTYIYEFLDERPDPLRTDPEQNFGLLRSDYSEKPAYKTLQRLIALTGSTNSAAPVPLAYSLTTGSGDVRQLLLQRDPKHLVLILWRDVQVWDRRARTPLDPGTVGSSIVFGQSISEARIANLTSDAEQSVATPRALHVDVPPSPIVIELTLP